MGQLAIGSDGMEVLELQRLLNRRAGSRIAVDGDFGLATRAAIVNFQGSRNLPATGVYDEATRLALVNTKENVVAASGTAEIARRILNEANMYVGLTEASPNARWDDPTTRGQDAAGLRLRTKLEEVGWQAGWAYCLAFTEVCWRYGYEGRPEAKLVSKILNPSVMQSFHNCVEEGLTSNKPVPGAIFFLQNGGGSTGHAGIVISVGPDSYGTIEGNTSQGAGSTEQDRNGDGCFRKSRPYNFQKRSTGMWLRGFLNPFTRA